MSPLNAQHRRPSLLATLASGFTGTRLALALIAGLAQAASLAWPLAHPNFFFSLLGLRYGQPVWWLQVLALAVLAGLLSRRRGPWQLAALWGWVFATAWLAATFWWIFVALHTYGGLPAPLAVLAVLVLAGLLALYYAAVCGLFMAVAPVNRAQAAIVFAALWLLAELARGVWLTGFGWGAAGYAHMDGPLAAFAPWLGLYGVCALAAWLAMTLAQVVGGAAPGDPAPTRSGRHRWVGILAAALLLMVPALMRPALPAWSTPTGTLSVTLLQGNIPQDEKFEPGSGVPQALQWYGDALQRAQTALVIAPETALPLLPQQLPPGYWDALRQRFASGAQAALIGMPLGNYQAGYTNSVLGLKPGQVQAWRYDKHHLVPFGEFIPPFFKWFTEMMNIPLGDFNRGTLRQPPFEWQGQRLATNICYEDLFGEGLGQLFDDPALTPTIFVNISNLGWFGNSLAMDQHLQIARMRALEFERPFVLATNTGVTAFMDHRGRVVSALARDTRAVLVGEVQGRDGVTPYAWWVARAGLWPLWLLAVGVVGLAARARLSKR